MWLASRRPTTGDRCGCMSIFTSTPSASRARVPPLTYVLLQSSLGLRSHGLETGSILRQGQDSQGRLEMRMEHRKMRIWLTCLTSWEGAEPCDRDRQTCDFSSSDINAFSYFVISILIWQYCFQLFCYFHCDLTLLLLVILLFPLWPDIVVFSYFVIFIVIYHYDFQLLWHCDLTLLSFVVKSNMLSLFHLSITIITSSIWSYLLYDDLSKMQKRNVCRPCVLSFARLFQKCNLRYQLCPGYKLFLLFC